MAVARSTKPQKTQNQRILDKLSKGPLSKAQAERMGIMSVSSRVNELRKAGHPINNQLYSRNGRTAIRYVLAA